MVNSVERLALGTLLPAFQGLSVPDWVLRRVDEGLAGVTLFGFNIETDDQLRTLTRSLRSSGELLICLDEEGGDVTRITYRTGSRYPGNAALGVIDDVTATREVYHAIGADLVSLGVNVDFAPSADVNSEAENPVIGIRAFGTSPDLVARHTAAAVEGLQGAGVAASVKHFPGHGATRQDSHLEVPLVDVPLSKLSERELVPFRAAIEAGVRLVMTAHVRVPALTGAEPATLSSAALGSLLRDELGFTGAVVTDAMDMKAITERVGLARGCALSVAAGSDLICLGPLPTPDDVAAIVAAMVTGVEEGWLPLSRLEDAASRVGALREWLRSADGFGSGRERADGVGLAAARRAIQVSGNGSGSHAGGFGLVDPLVVEVDSPPTIAVGTVPWGLAPFFAGALRLDPATDSAEGVIARAKDRGLVIVVRDAHRHPDNQTFVSALLAQRPDAYLVEMGLPYWRPRCGGFIATYGSALVNAQAAAELLTAAR
ncbi:glycoside hydrolase family 3 protein [Flindersiella endophytica]